MTDRFPAEVGTNARLKIGVGGVATSARRWLDLVAGTGVTLTPVDDGVNEKVSVTVAVTGAPPTGNAGGDLTGTYPNPTIGAGKVVTASILDANVTTAKIADANITTAKIADLAVTSAKISHEAWAAWTPTVTASTGTITTVGALDGAWYRVGRLIVWRLQITITTNGTGAGSVRFTLPVDSRSILDALGSGQQFANNKSLSVVGAASATTAGVFNYDGTYPGASGVVLLMTGSYEAAS